MRHSAPTTLVFALCTATLGQPTVTKVAIRGDKAGPVPGAVFIQLNCGYPPTINKDGLVSFFAARTGSPFYSYFYASDVWAEVGLKGGATALVQSAAPDNPAPGSAYLYNLFFSAAQTESSPSAAPINDQGIISVYGNLWHPVLRPSPAYPSFLATGIPGGISVVANTDDPIATGLPPGFTASWYGSNLINSEGTIASTVYGLLKLPDNFQYKAAESLFVVRGNRIVPVDLAIFDSSTGTGASLRLPSMNDLNDVVYVKTFIDLNAIVSRKTVVAVARAGLPAGANGVVGPTYLEVAQMSDDDPRGTFLSTHVNNHGDVGWLGQWRHENGISVTYRRSIELYRNILPMPPNPTLPTQGPAQLVLIAQEGQTLPGSGTYAILGFYDWMLNNFGQVAFEAQFDGKEGIWTDAGHTGTLAKVAMSGDVAPGTGGMTYTQIMNYAINDSGQVAFKAFYDNYNKSGLWMYDGNTGLTTLLIKSGDVVSLSPTSGITVQWFNIVTSGSAGSGPRSLNNAGDLVFAVGYPGAYSNEIYDGVLVINPN